MVPCQRGATEGGVGVSNYEVGEMSDNINKFMIPLEHKDISKVQDLTDQFCTCLEVCMMKVLNQTMDKRNSWK